MEQCKEAISNLAIIPDNAVSSVGSKDDNGGNRRFQGSVQVCETLNVQHVNLIHKEHTWHQLCNALVNVFVHHLIYLSSKFVWEQKETVGCPANEL